LTDSIVTSWQTPDNGGSPITSFTIEFRHSDGTTFSTEPVNCSGSDPSQLSCQIPATILNAAPFSLAWGDSVYAIVTATNIYGNSLASNEGNGGIIVRIPDAPLSLLEDETQRTATTLGLVWTNGVENGGLAILDYRINIALESDGIYSVLASNIQSQQYLAETLTPGVTYKFTVEARNSHGYSALSDEIVLLAAFKPEAPTVVSTANLNDKVVVSWNEPVDNGSPITQYLIYIRDSVSVLQQESAQCDGASEDVLQARTCSIDLSILTADPFNLVLNDEVFAALVSRNAYGDSPMSLEFAGAHIYLVPDAPVNLLNDALVTSDLSIRFTWDQGASDGGSPVLDFDVYYDEASGNWVLLDAGIADQSYETSASLTPNSLYSFKVTARN
jgi:hypothetical protein